MSHMQLVHHEHVRFAQRIAVYDSRKYQMVHSVPNGLNGGVRSQHMSQMQLVHERYLLGEGVVFVEYCSHNGERADEKDDEQDRLVLLR
jgi:hypothetical protein